MGILDTWIPENQEFTVFVFVMIAVASSMQYRLFSMQLCETLLSVKMNFEISSVSGIILSCRKTYDLS
jgi:hypothetical protein